MFGLPIAFALLQVILMTTCFAKETPKYQISKGNTREATDTIKLYGSNRNTTDEVMEDFLGSDMVLLNTGKSEAVDNDVTMKDLFKQTYRRALWIGCLLSFFQQVCGNNVVIFYSSTLFSHCEGSEESCSSSAGQIGTAILGVVNLVATIVCTFILNCTGRKVMLGIGFFGMMCTTGALGVAYQFDERLVMQLAIFCHAAFFQSTAGPIM